MPANDQHAITLGLIQHACGDDPVANLDKAVGMIRDAADKGCDLAVTQELFTGVYFPQVESDEHFRLAEPIPGPTSDTLCDLAKELGIEIAASLFERRAPGVYHNTSIVIDTRGAIVGKYRKMHIPDDPRFYEKYYFTPGDSPSANIGAAMTGDGNEGKLPGVGWQTARTRHATVGTLICWDQWFPEAARLTALRGAQVLLYPTAIGFIPEDGEDVRRAQRDAWRTVQRSHAITNGVFVCAVNRVGREGEIQFYGSSFVADPAGRVIAEASETDEQVLIVPCDLAQIESQRQGWPFLRDRRIDAYGDLLRRLVDR